MRVGQPVVQWGQTHFGAVAHKQKDKGRFEPRFFCGPGMADKPAQLVHAFHHRFHAFWGIKSHGKQNIAHHSQGNAHRTDDEVLPRGFKGPLMSVKVYERRAGKRGAFYAHPQSAQMGSGGHKGYG